MRKFVLALGVCWALFWTFDLTFPFFPKLAARWGLVFEIYGASLFMISMVTALVYVLRRGVAGPAKRR